MYRDTHYIPAFCEHNGFKRKAVCGVWILREQHRSDPTCPDCQLWLVAEDATSHQTAEDRFGPAPEPSAPKPIEPLGDITGGHERR